MPDRRSRDSRSGHRNMLYAESSSLGVFIGVGVVVAFIVIVVVVLFVF